MESKQNELFILHDEDKQKRSTERQRKGIHRVWVCVKQEKYINSIIDVHVCYL